MVSFLVVLMALTLVTTHHHDGAFATYLRIPSAHALTFLSPISRTRASSQSSVLTTTTTVRRTFSSTSGHCHFHTMKRRKTSELFVSSASLKDSIEEENNSNNATMVKASYQRVAEQDPEWFQEYVLSILGEDSLDENELFTTTTTTTRVALAPLESTAEIRQPQLQEEKYIAMTSREEVVASTSLMSNGVAPSFLSVSDSRTENVEHGNPGLERQSQLESSNEQLVSKKDEKNQALSLSSSVSSKPDERQRFVPPNRDETEAVVERVRRIFDDVVEELHPTSSSRDDDEEADDAAIAASMVQEGQVVEPVKDNKKDGEAGEKVLGPRVKNDDGKREGATIASSDGFSTKDKADQNLFEPLSSQPPDAHTALVNPSSVVSSPSKESAATATAATARETSASTQQPLSSKQIILQEDESIDTIKDDRVVVYKGSMALPWRRVPVANLTGLGYTEREIASLQPDALDLIVSERITKPRSGIPPRWKITKSTETRGKGQGSSNIVGSVQIMSTSDADRFVKQQRAERVYQNENDKQEGDTATSPRGSAAAGPDGLRRDGEPQRGTRERGERAWNGVDEQNRASQDDSDRRRQQRRRERTRYTDDGRPKRVYSGRPDGPGSRSRERRDPPAPDSFLWLDVDTFRDLLRKEAGFRLAILGEDWSGVVKDESDWRLNLYKDWLWTLHNGWGSPIVESRSDRMRKNLNRARPPPREPRQQQQQQRPLRPPSDDGNDTDDDKRRPRPRAKRPNSKQEED
jgi:hypothetical protein